MQKRKKRTKLKDRGRIDFNGVSVYELSQVAMAKHHRIRILNNRN